LGPAPFGHEQMEPWFKKDEEELRGLPRLVEARYVRDFVLWLRFSDGTSGEVDLAGELHGPIFEPLRNSAYFATFVLHPDLHTVVWPNGADLAPEFLYSRVRAHA
jgi:hypothetical protein